MSSDASQSILRMTLLACATAAFMVMWTGDSSRTVGMTLAERNRSVYPGHALAPDRPQLVQAKSPRAQQATTLLDPALRIPAVTQAGTNDSFQTLPGGSYRVVFEDGRVEWLTVIDRDCNVATSESEIRTTIVNGQRAHLIRVSARPAFESPLR